MGYIAVPPTPTQTDLAEEAFAYIQEQVPGWLPSDGNLEAWLIQALAQLAAELQVLAMLVPESIFMYLGESILQLPPYAATRAYGYTTWNVVDAAGYTISAGTLVSITPPASTSAYTFQTVQDVVIAPGATSALSVQVTAIDTGAAQSGITGAVAVLDPLDFVSSVYLESPTTGGSDGETADAYLSRLSDLLTLMSPRPILAPDHAVLVEHMIPEVARATSIDLYNAQTGAHNVPRCVTTVIAGPNGLPCSLETKAAALQLLQSMREVNFLVFIADPTYTTVDVAFIATSFPGFDPNEVAGRAVAAVTSYLSPQNWGLPPFGDPGSPRSWINDTTVRMLEIATVINNTDGINYITTLQLAVHGSALGTADVVMAGVAPLPKAGTIRELYADAMSNGRYLVPRAVPPPPPAALTPDTFAGRLYLALAPLAQWDNANGWALLILCNALGLMYQDVENLVRDTSDGVGWSALLDLDRCPDAFLPWLAQLVGVRVLPNTTPDQMRQRIASTDGFRRGTVAAMIGAAQATLTGAQRVDFRERSGGPVTPATYADVKAGNATYAAMKANYASYSAIASPDYAYYLTVATYDSETPNATATLNAMLAAKPGALVLNYLNVIGQTYASVKARFATYAALKAAYPDYLAVRQDHS